MAHPFLVVGCFQGSPSLSMPTARHLTNRHAWHDFLLRLVISHWLEPGQLYSMLPEPQKNHKKNTQSLLTIDVLTVPSDSSFSQELQATRFACLAPNKRSQNSTHRPSTPTANLKSNTFEGNLLQLPVFKALTLDGPLEEGLAGLARGGTVMVARRHIATDQTQALSHGAQQEFAFHLGLVLHQPPKQPHTRRMIAPLLTNVLTIKQ